VWDSLAGLELPGGDDGIFDDFRVAVFEVGDDHHVLGEASWHRERVGERVKQEVSEVERCTDDDVAVVELSGDQASSVSLLEQAVAAALGDTLELSREAADVGGRHAASLGRT
jgi:hypothetical protein